MLPAGSMRKHANFLNLHRVQQEPWDGLAFSSLAASTLNLETLQDVQSLHVTPVVLLVAFEFEILVIRALFILRLR